MHMILFCRTPQEICFYSLDTAIGMDMYVFVVSLAKLRSERGICFNILVYCSCRIFLEIRKLPVIIQVQIFSVYTDLCQL